MTLLIALLANSLYAHQVGEPFIATGWIIAIWVAHLVAHSSSENR